MPHAYEVIGGYVTAPSTTYTALTMMTGDSLTIKSSTKPKLVQAWTKHQAAGTLRIRCNEFPDPVQGLTFQRPFYTGVMLIPWGMNQRLEALRTLIVEMTGSATAGDIEIAHLVIQYDDLPAYSPVLMTPEEVYAQMEDLFVTNTTIATAATGDYGGAEAINTDFNAFRAGKRYAVLGYQASATAGGCFIRGPDTGNLRMGGPIILSQGDQLTSNWFVQLSRAIKKPMIPVLDFNNLTNTLVDVSQDENGTDTTISWVMAQLPKK